MQLSVTEELRLDPAAFCDRVLLLNEKGNRWTLTEYQRSVLRWAFERAEDGRRLARTVIWSEPKKSGKTMIAAVLVLHHALTTPNTEILIAANDREQAVSRVFNTMVALIEKNSALKQFVTVRAQSLEFQNGTTVTAIPSSYRTVAGARQSLTVYDELWAYDRERAERLFEELTPPPTEPDAWVLIVTYAGFSGESKLLENLYQRALAGPVENADGLELYQADELRMFWSHRCRQAWQTDEYLAQQRRSLRSSAYLRLWENRWVTNESSFIDAEMWDACVDLNLRPALPPFEHEEVWGFDGALGREGGDWAVAVGVRREADRIVLVGHKIWKPMRGETFELGAIEEFIRQLSRLRDARVFCDPYQMVSSVQRLKSEGVRIREFPQTVPNCTRMTTTLYEAIKNRNLVLYADAELREAALHTITIEHPRGVRLAKMRRSAKIDPITALAIACVAAVEQHREIDDIQFVALGEVPPVTQEEQERLDRERKDESAREIRRIIAERGVYWPGEH